jgi:hypothetical protein
MQLLLHEECGCVGVEKKRRTVFDSGEGGGREVVKRRRKMKERRMEGKPFDMRAQTGKEKR